MRFAPLPLVLTLALVAGLHAPLAGQGMPPTPLTTGAYAQFTALANPDLSVEKTDIYGVYSVLIDRNGRVVNHQVKTLLQGEGLVSISKILSSTSLTEADVLAAGVDPAAIQSLVDSADGPITFTQYRFQNDNSPAATPAEYRSSASAQITVMPALGADQGVVTIQDTLGYKRYFSVPLSNGVPATVTVSGMEAGVATFTIDLRANGNSLLNPQQPAIQRYTLRKDGTKYITLAESGTSPAYPLARIERVLITQSSQNDEGTATLLAGRRGKFLAYLWDGQSRAGAAQVTLRANFANGSSQAIPIGYSGTAYFSSTDQYWTEADITGELMQPGTTFALEARLADGTLLTRTYTPNIQQGKRVTVHVYEVSPGPGFSGVPVARDAAGFRDQIAQWVEAELPIAGIDLDIRPGFPWPPSNPGTLWSDPGYTIADLANLALWMDQIAGAEGHPRTDGNIYLAMINGRYAQTSFWGITAGGKGSPGIAMFMYSQELARHVVAHEMGHSYWLGHAPSPGATSDPNPLDWDYPYGGDSMIAFAPWHPINGGLMSTTDTDLMAYGWYGGQWISDWNWQRFFDRTQGSAYSLAAPSTAGLFPAFQPGVPFVIGPKEAQALADRLERRR